MARFQATASLPQSGAVDDATLKALFWAAKDKREIKYNGKSYYIGYPDEYNLLSAKLIKKAEAQTTYYLNMAKGVRGMWDAHRDARNNNKFFAFIVDEATGVKFPAESVITAAENGAKSIVGAAKSNDYKAFQDALAKFGTSAGHDVYTSIFLAAGILCLVAIIPALLLEGKKSSPYAVLGTS